MYSASEKLAIIHLVEDSELSIRRTLVEINVSRSSFYRWYQAYARDGPDGLQNHSRASRQHQSQGEKIHITSRLETEGQERY